MAGDTSVLGNSYGMMGGGGAMIGSMQLMGSESKQVMGVPKSAVGKIIGRGGEIISVMQKKSGARVTVDQSIESDCKAIITGTPQAIAMAQSMIQEILNGVNPSLIGANLPMPGGMGRGGAMMSPYGMAMPQQQQYGMGAMGMYGMPQQQPQYGAYGAGYGEFNNNNIFSVLLLTVICYHHIQVHRRCNNNSNNNKRMVDIQATVQQQQQLLSTLTELLLFSNRVPMAKHLWLQLSPHCQVLGQSTRPMTASLTGTTLPRGYLR
jgi:hypothetical protein